MKTLSGGSKAVKRNHNLSNVLKVIEQGSKGSKIVKSNQTLSKAVKSVLTLSKRAAQNSLKL